MKTATITFTVKHNNVLSGIRRYIPSKRICKATLIRVAKGNIRGICESTAMGRWPLVFFMMLLLATVYILMSTFLVAYLKGISQSTHTKQVSSIKSQFTDTKQVTSITSQSTDTKQVSSITSQSTDTKQVSSIKSQSTDTKQVSSITSQFTDTKQVSPITLKSVKKKADFGHRISQRGANVSRATLISKYHMKGPTLRRTFNCSLLFKGNKTESKKVKNYLIKHKGDRNIKMIPEAEAAEMLKQCQAFKSIRGYAQTAKTVKERNFPLAYVILMHEGFEQMERLVRALYQPQNVFCIHVDLKSPESLHQTVRAYASCFPNIRVASVQYNVTYAHVSRLLADIACMKDLSKLNNPWRYLITGVSTEFPLRSNKEKVEIFTALNGSNHIREAWSIRMPERYKMQYKEVDGKMQKTGLHKKPAPHNITIVKGMSGNAFSRAFVDWFYKNKMARDLLEWSRDTYSPDEHYWGTLNDLYHNPFLKTPGGYEGHPDTKRYRCTFAVWVSSTPFHTTPCYGRVRHNLCCFGILDLPVIKDQQFLKANKVDLKNDPVAYACMEELLEFREKHPQPIKIGLFVDPIMRNRKRNDFKKEEISRTSQ